jgi:hypothetical protein
MVSLQTMPGNMDLNMATKQEVFATVNLFKRLPNSPITADPNSLTETVDLFHAVLEDLPAEMVKAATVQYLSEGNPFFPTPGTLREKAMDLQLLAMGIPTPAEAWGMVLNGLEMSHARFCEEGARLRDACNNAADYMGALIASKRHDKDCSICDYGGFREDYKHPAVTETVRLLGGRDVILTDNPTADRARFIDAYREIVAKEKMKMGMTPTVARFVEDKRQALDTGEQKYIDSQIKTLTEKVS